MNDIVNNKKGHNIVTTNSFAHKPVDLFVPLYTDFISIKIYTGINVQLQIWCHYYNKPYYLPLYFYIYILLYASEIYSRFSEWFWRIKYCLLQLFVLFDIRFFVN